MNTTPQAALLSAQNPLLKRCYTMSESHLSGYRVVIGFERLEDAQDAHEYIAKLKATQEPVQSVPEAMKVVTEALRSDPDYAWSWHCNVAMASVDEGMGHYEANQAAARFMRLLAGVDTTKHQGFPEAPEQEPVQAGELPPPPTLSDDERQWLHYNPNTSDIEEWVYGYAVAYARAALSARKPLSYDLICNAIDLADTESMKADYMLDSNDCIAVVRTMQALIEINGIGLEVKP